jgi:hypothetical protein
MNNTSIKFQAHFFSNMEDVIPSADTIPIFLDIFRDKEFLPSTFQEISPGSMELKNRLNLASPNNEWTITIPRDRIIIQKNLLNFNNKNLGTIDDFAKDSLNFFSRILKKFPRTGHRISLLSTMVSDEISDDKMQKIYKNIFNPPGIYKTHHSEEWKANMAIRKPIRIGDKEDDLNVISVLLWLNDNPNPIQYGILPFFDLSVLKNRILIEFDTNTYQGRIESRFNIDSIGEYFIMLAELQKSLLDEWEPVLNVK